MTREERLEWCKVCQHETFDKAKGKVCGLTNEPATFEQECADFVEHKRKARIADSIKRTKVLDDKTETDLRYWYGGLFFVLAFMFVPLTGFNYIFYCLVFAGMASVISGMVGK